MHNTYSISDLRSEEVLDSRGNPTIEVTAVLANGVHARATVPSGASTGRFEAIELRDQDPSRYGGKGVLHACANTRGVILPALRGMDITEQQKIDRTMIDLDGTANKAKLGANAMLAVSLACARLAAKVQDVPLYQSVRATFHLPMKEYALPTPMLNIINGGRHADNGIDFQEYMIVPHAPTFAEKMRMASEIYFQLGALLRSKGFQTLIGDEGGFAPKCVTNHQPLDLLSEAISRTPYRTGRDVTFGLDIAASEFYLPEQHRYFLTLEKRLLDSTELIARYKELVTTYPLTSIEDGLTEDDWDGWVTLTQQLKKEVLLVGDDLFVTNKQRLERGVTAGAANAIIIKPNQIGTLTETIETVASAQKSGYTVVISHRSGETDDAFIADLAVAVQAPFIKAGAVARGERLAKYNRLLEIEQELAE